MLQLSVIIPHHRHRNQKAADPVAAEMLRVAEAVRELGLSFEIIVVDDHSPLSDVETLQRRLLRLDGLKLLRLDRQVGLSGMLTAGIAAAQGQQILAVGAGDDYPIHQLPELLVQLTRCDLVVGRPRRRGIAKMLHRLMRIPRWFLLGLEVRDPECLYWAARREALQGLELCRGMYRYLASHVAMRGYRVGEVLISSPKRRRWAADSLPNPGDLLVTWWLMRRRSHFTVQEIFCEGSSHVVKLPDVHGAGQNRVRIPPKRRRSA